MNIQELLGEGMSVEEINDAIADKTFVDSSSLPPSVSKATFDKTASELASAKHKITELENANLSADEKLEKALADAQKAQDEYTAKSVRLDVEKVLVAGGLTGDDYKDVIDGIVSTDREKSVSMATNLVNLLTAQRQAEKNAVMKELQVSLKNPPKGKDDKGEMTKEEFDKLTLTEKIQFKETHPEEYKELFGGN